MTLDKETNWANPRWYEKLRTTENKWAKGLHDPLPFLLTEAEESLGLYCVPAPSLHRATIHLDLCRRGSLSERSGHRPLQ